MCPAKSDHLRDQVFPVKDFWENYGSQNLQEESTGQIEERKHYRSTWVSTPNPPKWITINVMPSAPSTWSSAIANAATNWNGLYLNVRFAVQSSSSWQSGAINVQGAVLGTGIIADALHPSNGNPGNRIRINTNGPATGSLQKTYTMTHEIGHALGFYHTDIAEGTLLTNVSNTCKNNADANSVMRQGNNAWNGFSTCDLQAFDANY